jgi:MerR family transcriptional regulator, light-induced transcriptional regulator
MDHFSISELSRLSGVKPFTIRIWEKRYNALDPDRSPGNTRYYNNKQLRRLLNIVSLMEYDHKISELSAMSDRALFRLIEKRKTQEHDELERFFISQLIAAGYTYDEPHFTNLFAQCVARFGVKNAYIKVLYPMLQRLGILWNSDSINAGNEHFITNLLRQKILTAADLLPSPSIAAETWLLFLPENEFHETGLLMAHYLIRHAGKKSIYLGANLPTDALIAAAAIVRPDNILLFFVQNQTFENKQNFLHTISTSIKSSRIYAAGAQLSGNLAPSKRTHFLQSVSDLEKLLG